MDGSRGDERPALRATFLSDSVGSTDLGEEQVRLVLAYHALYPEAIERRIEAADELERALSAVR